MFADYKGIDASLLIRTDFSDDAKWELLVELASAPYEDDFRAFLHPVDDVKFKDMAVAEIIAAATSSFEGTTLFIADSQTLDDAEHPILCLSPGEGAENSFRVIPSQLWSVENNLSLSNMDFGDFYSAKDSDGVFRGFK
jgi:hypothetical protein